jgi:hypothetical protein
LTDPALLLLPLLQVVKPCCCQVHVTLLLLHPADAALATAADGLLLHACQPHPHALLLLGCRRV